MPVDQFMRDIDDLPVVDLPDWELVGDLETSLRPYHEGENFDYRLSARDSRGTYYADSAKELEERVAQRGEPPGSIEFVLTGRESDGAHRSITISLGQYPRAFFLSGDEAIVDHLEARTKKLFGKAAERAPKTDESPRSAQPTTERDLARNEEAARSRFWILGDPRFQGLIAITGIVATVLIAVVLTRDGNSSDTGQSKPSNLIEQIAQRRFWVEPPITFESAQEAVSSGTPSWNYAAVERGDPIAFTPAGLSDAAEGYDGVQVYLVGRVVAIRALPDDFGLSEELQLAPSDRDRHGGGVDAYIGSAGTLFVSEGDVVFALGRVAATGETRVRAGINRSTVYFVALDPATGIDYDGGDTDLFAESLSPSIREAVSQIQREN